MLFDEAVIFTDIHFGEKNNSRTHNIDCEEFIKWMIDEAQKRGIRKCLFLGDWHHNRSSINVSTLNYTISNLERLNKAFDEVIMITGNHDLFYREKREIHSIPMVDKYKNIRMINDGMEIIDDCAFVPWLVEDEYKKLKDIDVKYVFGHFELPTFYLNAMVQMPDHGNVLKPDHLHKAELVFSGHFHKRQRKGNIIYPGNCFPHNYGDAWDDDRGITFLKWGGEPEYLAWPDAPKYRTINLSKLIDNPEKVLSNKTSCRITLDVSITYEEANFIKETFLKQFDLREITLLPSKKEEHAHDWSQGSEIQIENVDTIVLNQLATIESEVIKNDVLMSIYNSLN